VGGQSVTTAVDSQIENNASQTKLAAARSFSMHHQNWFRFVMATLATWRLTHLIAAEDGPGEIIANLRQWLGNGFFGQLMDCFYCLSLWTAAPIALLLMQGWRQWPLLWLALSGACCMLERMGKHTSPTIYQLPKGDN
jgi:hypothetical protein